MIRDNNFCYGLPRIIDSINISIQNHTPNERPQQQRTSNCFFFIFKFQSKLNGNLFMKSIHFVTQFYDIKFAMFRQCNSVFIKFRWQLVAPHAELFGVRSVE